jgi:hypothetical protein
MVVFVTPPRRLSLLAEETYVVKLRPSSTNVAEELEAVAFKFVGPGLR